MELVNDLGTDLAFAFLVEKRYQQKIDSEQALALIGRIKDILESLSAGSTVKLRGRRDKNTDSFAAH